MDHSLSDLYHQLAHLAAKYGAERLVLFGSRAREDYKRTSDIDLAIYGMPKDNQSLFWWDVEELPTLLKFDLVHVSQTMDPAFIKNIEQDGVTLYEKVENYINAFAQLAQAVEITTAQPENTLYRDGLIQRFEFTVELAWKSLKEYLEDQGAAVEHATPKAVLKDAFAAGIVEDSKSWVDILNARNLTSHIYNEETAISISKQICSEFLPTLHALSEFYKGN